MRCKESRSERRITGLAILVPMMKVLSTLFANDTAGSGLILLVVCDL